MAPAADHTHCARVRKLSLPTYLPWTCASTSTYPKVPEEPRSDPNESPLPQLQHPGHWQSRCPHLLNKPLRSRSTNINAIKNVLRILEQKGNVITLLSWDKTSSERWFGGWRHRNIKNSIPTALGSRGDFSCTSFREVVGSHIQIGIDPTSGMGPLFAFGGPTAINCNTDGGKVETVVWLDLEYFIILSYQRRIDNTVKECHESCLTNLHGYTHYRY